MQDGAEPEGLLVIPVAILRAARSEVQPRPCLTNNRAGPDTPGDLGRQREKWARAMKTAWSRSTRGGSLRGWAKTIHWVPGPDL